MKINKSLIWLFFSAWVLILSVLIFIADVLSAVYFSDHVVYCILAIGVLIITVDNFKLLLQNYDKCKDKLPWSTGR
jgi:hypothetical protein